MAELMSWKQRKCTFFPNASSKKFED